MPKRASVQKTKDGLLYKRFTPPPNMHGNQKRIFVQCPPDRNTHTFLDRLVREALDRHMSGRFTTDDTFKSYVEEKFLKEYPAAKNLCSSTEWCLRYYLEKLVIPTIGVVPLGAVDNAVVTRLVLALKKMRKHGNRGSGQPYSDRTINLIVASVVTVLRWAARNKDIPFRPEIDLPKVRKYQRQQPYTREESAQLVTNARNAEVKALLLLIYDAGLRKGEALGLQWEQMDWAHHAMVIDRQLDSGAPKKGTRHTKSARERRVPMSATLEASLREIRHLRGPYVFCKDDGAPYGKTWLHLRVEEARRAAGLRAVRIHDGRHAFATNVIDAGIDAFKLQAMLGHSSIRTTQDYVHPTLPTLRSVME